MKFESYEISLWSLKDEFLATLGISSKDHLYGVQNPVFTTKTDGEETLNFTLPIITITEEDKAPVGWGTAVDITLPQIYFNDEGKVVIDNKEWYSALTTSKYLQNERKVKLIFDKNLPTMRIHEFVIVNLKQRREGESVYCDVECGGLVFYELGKVGYGLTFDQDLLLAEEEEQETTLYPTLDFWLDKVFPASQGGWGYRIETNYKEVYQNSRSDKVYEEPGIMGWTKEGDDYLPVYREEPIEKIRFPSIEKSNKYNIVQDLAELYGVYVHPEFTYPLFYDSGHEYAAGAYVFANGYIYRAKTKIMPPTAIGNTESWQKIGVGQPYVALKKELVFYNKPFTSTEYAITYGDNETGLEKTSDSKNIVTKLYVENIESEYSNSGLLSIATASGNYSLEDFILNFSYYEQAGMLSPKQLLFLHGDGETLSYEAQLRTLNLQLEEALNSQFALLDKKFELTLNTRGARDAASNAQTVVNDLSDKLSKFDETLATQVLEDSKIFYMVLGDAEKYIALRRDGILANGKFLVTDKEGNVLTKDTDYILITNTYGNVVRITFPLAATISVQTGQIVYLSYEYDLVSFYKNERSTYDDVYNLNTLLAEDIEENLLPALEVELDDVQSNIDDWVAAKKDLHVTFEQVMGYFLKEGSWSSENHQGPYEHKSFIASISNGGIYFDESAQSDEITNSYKIGVEQTLKYYYYILIDDDPIAYSKPDSLVLLEKNSEGEIIKRYIVNSHFTLHHIKVDNTIKHALIFNKHIIEGWGGVLPVLHYVKEDGTNVSLSGKILQLNAQSLVVYRRIKITDLHALRYSLSLNNNGAALAEFYDYTTTVTSLGEIVVTLKINNNILGSANSLTVEYKSDRTVEQLYFDAQEVSKQNAFPQVEYEVSFIYLQKALNSMYNPAPSSSDYFPLLSSYNNELNLELGGIVRITDPKMDLHNVKGIISEISLSLDSPENNSFVIQNYKTRFEDIFSRIVAATEQIASRGYAYEKAAAAISPTTGIVGDILQSAILNNSLAYSIGGRSEVVWDENGIKVTNLTPYTTGIHGLVVIKGGGIFLSDRLADDGVTRLYTTAITPQGINASAMTIGRIDTEKINIYSGSQIRFAWMAEGLYAYGSKDSGATDYNTYIRYNEDGFLFVRNHTPELRLNWEGLLLSTVDGRVTLTGEHGLSVYNRDEKLLVRLGRFGNYPNDEYGLRLYRVINGVSVESLIADSDGQLWLSDTLLVGLGTGMVGITGTNNFSTSQGAIRMWGGHASPLSAPFYFTDEGYVKAISGNIGGMSLSSDHIYHGGTGEGDYVALGYSGDYRIWAGHSNPASALFSITKRGHLYATTGEIAGDFTVSGNLGSPQFASGELGNGWRIDGASGYAEFNDVFVRGTIAASVFEYQQISSVGGQLYVAPTLILFNNSNAITIKSSKYEILFTNCFSNLAGGRAWGLQDVVSLNGFITQGGTTYELRNVECRITNMQGTNVTFTTILDSSALVCYDSNDNVVNFSAHSWAGSIVERNATAVYMGTYSDGNLLRKGILLSATGNYTPFIDVYDDTGINQNPKVRLGNLTGITDTYFGPLNGYGLYSQNVYLTGAIYSKAGNIGNFTISDDAIYSAEKATLLDLKQGVYLGSDGIALGPQKFVVLSNGDFSFGGGAIAYDAVADRLEIRANNVSIGTSSNNLSIDELLGYRMEIIATSDILSVDIQTTTLSARVWHGSQNVTDAISENRFNWERVSSDTFGDEQWNLNHKGMKTIILQPIDVYYSATYTCALLGA